MTRWGMVIDLNRCIGCGTCKEICTQFNKLPRGAQWRRVIEKDIHGDSIRRIFFSMGCMHCDRPSCMEVCPVGATKKQPDGIVVIDTEICIGCAACIMACPYRARSITIDQIIPSASDSAMSEKAIGVCTKCDFCRQRIEKGIEQKLIPGIDKTATPICVCSCIADALHFGDLDNPESNVSKLIRDNPNIQLNRSFHNDPAVFYIYIDVEKLKAC
jgi:phenylacetyl-CoA:acceptor oxidoreductase 27-kDa subunit